MSEYCLKGDLCWPPLTVVLLILFLSLVLLQDSSAVLDEEQSKKPCRKFLQKGRRIQCIYLTLKIKKKKMEMMLNDFFVFIEGICDYGPNCRFSHMSEQDIFYLKRQVEGKN